MKISKLTLAIATVLGASVSAGAMAMDLYVDSKTKQIFSEPGRGRELMGAFEKVQAAPAKAAATSLDSAEIKAIREDLALKSNEIKALSEQAQTATEPTSMVTTMDKKGLIFESRDKNYKFKIGGRIQADADYMTNGNLQTVGNTTLAGSTFSTPGSVTGTPVNANDGTEFRRARLDFEGTVWKDWNFKTEVDFANNAAALKDLWLRYSGLSFMDITGGQQKQNFSREVWESDNDLLFTEYSLMYALTKQITERAIGLNFQSKNQKQWSLALGAFGDTAAASTVSSTSGGEGWATSGRLTVAPIEEKTKVVHLGVSGNYRVPNANGYMEDATGMTYAYKANNLSGVSLLSSTITGSTINSVSMMGLEANGMHGPYSVGGEYTKQWVSRNTGYADLQFDAYTTEAAWTITGESRKYKNGKFARLEPAKPFSLKSGGLGAWELATRYSFVDLNSGTHKGGQASNMTVGLNWHINTNLRIMADYSKTFSLNNPYVKSMNFTDPDSIDSYTVRAQMAY
jgi:phosphate-selective porin OprO/OprP